MLEILFCLSPPVYAGKSLDYVHCCISHPTDAKHRIVFEHAADALCTKKHAKLIFYYSRKSFVFFPGVHGCMHALHQWSNWCHHRWINVVCAALHSSTDAAGVDRLSDIWMTWCLIGKFHCANFGVVFSVLTRKIEQWLRTFVSWNFKSIFGPKPLCPETLRSFWCWILSSILSIIQRFTSPLLEKVSNSWNFYSQLHVTTNESQYP